MTGIWGGGSGPLAVKATGTAPCSPPQAHELAREARPRDGAWGGAGRRRAAGGAQSPAGSRRGGRWARATESPPRPVGTQGARRAHSRHARLRPPDASAAVFPATARGVLPCHSHETGVGSPASVRLGGAAGASADSAEFQFWQIGKVPRGRASQGARLPAVAVRGARHLPIEHVAQGLVPDPRVHRGAGLPSDQVGSVMEKVDVHQVEGAAETERTLGDKGLKPWDSGRPCCSSLGFLGDVEQGLVRVSRGCQWAEPPAPVSLSSAALG